MTQIIFFLAKCSTAPAGNSRTKVVKTKTGTGPGYPLGPHCSSHLHQHLMLIKTAHIQPRFSPDSAQIRDTSDQAETCTPYRT